MSIAIDEIEFDRVREAESVTRSGEVDRETTAALLRLNHHSGDNRRMCRVGVAETMHLIKLLISR